MLTRSLRRAALPAALALAVLVLPACSAPDEASLEVDAAAGATTQPPADGQALGEEIVPEPDPAALSALPAVDLKRWWGAKTPGCGGDEEAVELPAAASGLVLECRAASAALGSRIVNTGDAVLRLDYDPAAYELQYANPTTETEGITLEGLTAIGAVPADDPEQGVAVLPPGASVFLTPAGDGETAVTVTPDAGLTRASYTVQTVTQTLDRLPWAALGLSDGRWDAVVGCAVEAGEAARADAAPTIAEAVDGAPGCAATMARVQEAWAAGGESAAGAAAPSADALRAQVAAAATEPQKVLDGLGEGALAVPAVTLAG